MTSSMLLAVLVSSGLIGLGMAQSKAAFIRFRFKYINIHIFVLFYLVPLVCHLLLSDFLKLFHSFKGGGASPQSSAGGWRRGETARRIRLGAVLTTY